MTGVVVGVSKVAATTAAVRWASAEAARRGLPLRLVHAWDTPLNLSVDLSPGCLPGLQCDATAHAVHGPASAVLPAQACDLLVLGDPVGARRVSHLTRLCLRQATRPVVIVPDAQRPPAGRVMVGVNGSETSREALRWAADEARLCQDRLTVVHAWQLNPCRSRGVLRPARAVPAQRAAYERLHDWVHSVPGAIGAELTAAHGAPFDALLRASTEADPLVLGYHTRPVPPGCWAVPSRVTSSASARARSLPSRITGSGRNGIGAERRPRARISGGPDGFPDTPDRERAASRSR